MMDPEEAILDYASPRKRSGLRLPAKSTIEVQSQTGEILVVESLRGQTAAGIVGLVAGCTVLVAMAAIFSDPNNRRFMLWQQTVMLAGLAATEIALMIAVIHQTWRKTILIARPFELHLSFTSPFHRRNYRWTNEQIVEMGIYETGNFESPAVLGELRIVRTSGGLIQLFTDHPVREMRYLPDALMAMLHQTRAATTAAIPDAGQYPPRSETGPGSTSPSVPG